jgi:uncharacterized membrane protein SpoIIM required for sporulation
MIESLFRPSNVEQKPWEAFLAGFVFTMAAGIIMLQIGTTNPCNSGLGLLMVGFITIAATPFFLNVFRIEEERDEKQTGNLFERHRPVITIFAFFFLAVVFASSLFYIAMPQQISNYVFGDQANDLANRGIIGAENPVPIFTGNATSTGYATSPAPDFMAIFMNNMRVNGLAFVFSFVFGAGAVFIICWNATILGVLVGKIAEVPAQYGAPVLVQGNAFANYFASLPFTLIRILPHGIFEFGGYFIAGIAGGILSVAIVRENFFDNWQNIMKDSLIYLGISAVFILIGAAIEVAI